MDIKSSVTGHNQISILNSCEYGEEQAIETYENVVNENLEYLSVEQKTMISSQYALIKANYTWLKSIIEARKQETTL